MYASQPKMLSSSLFYCCEETPFVRQLVKEFIGAHSSRVLESMTIMAGSKQHAGRRGSGAVDESLHPDPQA